MGSGNIDLVRSIYEAWGRGDFSSAEWADPAIEFVLPDGLSPGSWTGVSAMSDAWREVLSAWTDFRAELVDCWALDEERVVVLTDNSGRGRTSSLEVGHLRTEGANLFSHPRRQGHQADCVLEPRPRVHRPRAQPGP